MNRSSLGIYIFVGILLLLAAGVTAIAGLTQAFAFPQKLRALAQVRQIASTSQDQETRQKSLNPLREFSDSAQARLLSAEFQRVLHEASTGKDADLLAACDAEAKRLAESSHRTTQLCIWLVIAFCVAGVYAGLRTYHRLREYYVTPLSQLTERLRIAACTTNALLRLNPRDSLELNTIAQLCNDIIDDRIRSVEEARERVKKGYESIHRLLEAFPEPTVVLTSTRELVADNPAAKELFQGDGGNSLYQHFLEALVAGQDSFASHGMTFTIVRPVHTATNASVEVYTLRR
ncbi:MAG: hypothetical protein IJJ26_01140 [Victivallales bacterium]|nr:hypothetical protein [Victivallales bacterium]